MFFSRDFFFFFISFFSVFGDFLASESYLAIFKVCVDGGGGARVPVFLYSTASVSEWRVSR